MTLFKPLVEFIVRIHREERKVPSPSPRAEGVIEDLRLSIFGTHDGG